MKNTDISANLQAQVKQAVATKQALYIHGGMSKHFYGNPVDGESLDVSKHAGVISYEPTELCITVRAGTLLSEVEKLLAEHQQILPFEPPHYFDINKDENTTTIGGAIAAGIAGPRRAYTGSVRDAILGVQIINGDGEIVNFGGQVMKNVAGYDLSRLMVRSQGTLGVILSVSIRLLPKPSHDLSLRVETSQAEALEYCQYLRLQQLPVTATVWRDEHLSIRLSASDATLKSCQQKIKGDVLTDDHAFWEDIRDHRHHFFGRNDKPLWRFSLPPASKVISRFDNEQLIEWGGAQRWVHSNAPANIIHSVAQSRKGFAAPFRSSVPDATCFPLLEPALLQLHKNLKRKMDPHNIFNPNRIYQGL